MFCIILIFSMTMNLQFMNKSLNIFLYLILWNLCKIGFNRACSRLCFLPTLETGFKHECMYAGIYEGRIRGWKDEWMTDWMNEWMRGCQISLNIFQCIMCRDIFQKCSLDKKPNSRSECSYMNAWKQGPGLRTACIYPWYRRVGLKLPVYGLKWIEVKV